MAQPLSQRSVRQARLTRCALCSRQLLLLVAGICAVQNFSWRRWSRAFSTAFSPSSSHEFRLSAAHHKSLRGSVALGAEKRRRRKSRPGSTWSAADYLQVEASGPSQILGVSPTASKQEIRKRFRALALVEHPDKKPDDPNAAENFRKITDAYKEMLEEAALPAETRAAKARAPRRRRSDVVDFSDSGYEDADFPDLENDNFKSTASDPFRAADDWDIEDDPQTGRGKSGSLYEESDRFKDMYDPDAPSVNRVRYPPGGSPFMEEADMTDQNAKGITSFIPLVAAVQFAVIIFFAFSMPGTPPGQY